MPVRYPPLRAHDMDVVGSCFGLRFVNGGGPNGMVELYVEDDEWFHYKESFNHVWLGDLLICLDKAVEHFKQPSPELGDPIPGEFTTT